MRRPRKFKFQKVYKYKHLESWPNTNLCLYEAWLQPVAKIKLSWNFFELIRLKLIWGLLKKKKRSRKTQFKQKKLKVKKLDNFFRKKKLLKHQLFWYHGFPHLSYTAKAKGTRMGKGKGSIKQWYQYVNNGHYFLKLRNSNFFKLNYVLMQLKHCLPGYFRYKVIITKNIYATF
jgi:hypothetical protein